MIDLGIKRVEIEHLGILENDEIVMIFRFKCGCVISGWDVGMGWLVLEGEAPCALHYDPAKRELFAERFGLD